MAWSALNDLRRWSLALSATPRRRRLVLVATLAPGVLVADAAVGVWHDAVMLGVGVVLIAAAILAQLRPRPRVLGPSARAAEPQTHRETRP